ncbi:vacuolar fusion protein CCZ1 homolog isoform X4 [Zingiber officinale]|uniref:vacuolar fusion protein CCZ1 homolog isoform X4 n=1 Tax=Zingiber officinale TaxID=94328 RepID=UPI001C4DB2A0|nr:vacuolar fusion protein CCZ1 homolog isoform X4 [Zingiber officinale]
MDVQDSESSLDNNKTGRKKRTIRCYHYNEGHVKDNCPKLKNKGKGKDKKPVQTDKYKTLKATWDETSFESEVEAFSGLALMTSHQEDEHEASSSEMSIESIDEGGVISEESNSSGGAKDDGIDKSLATVIGSSCIGGITCNSIILFQDLLVSTTLSPGDTANMFTYAVLRLTPHALSSKTSSWSYLRKGVSSSNVSVRSASLNTGSSLEDYQDGSFNTSPRGQGQTYHTARLLQTDSWSKGKDGFLVSGIHGEVGNLVDIPPIVWLQQTEEQVYLCVYQHRNLTIIFLIPVCTLIDGETGISHAKKQFLENASEKIVYVEEKLSKGFGGENAYHVSGYRYLLVDRDKSISRASPPGKVTTLAKDSLLAFNNLREEVDLKKARANREKPDCENNFEMCIRAKNNAWLIAKIARGRELYMVLEKANETLLYASDAVEKFSNRYCDGAFSLD